MPNPYAPKHRTPRPEPVYDPLSVVPVGTASELLAWVGDDPERAKLALEKEKKGHARKTVLAKLEDIK